MKTCSEAFLLLVAVLSSHFRCYGCATVKKGYTVTPVTKPVVHGEGPHWDEESHGLFFVDIQSQLVNRYDPITGEVTHIYFEGNGGVSLVVPVKGTHGHQLVASHGHDMVLFDWDFHNTTYESSKNSNGRKLATVDTEPTKTGNRWNDGKADKKGRIWAGTMGPEPVVGQVTPNQGSLFRLEAIDDFHPTVEVTPVSISNGLAWNKDNTKLYYIDTATDQVDVFDFDLESGTITNRRKVFNLKENGVAGHPDGMTIDSKGNLWVACFDGSQVINVNPNSGLLLQSIPIPASRVTSAMFGGDILYVTTSNLGLTPEEQKNQPHAGSVFAIKGLGVKALAPENKVVINPERITHYNA